MSTFPSDSTGDALRRMRASGDDLTKPRRIDFSFLFRERKQALAFAECVDDEETEVCISYYGGRQMWQVIAKHTMVPEHSAINDMETALTKKAQVVGGEFDGWGCFSVSS